MRRLILTTLLIVASAAHAQHRPPAVPLIANDPYFSLWSMADKLTDQPTKHWSEAPQPFVGLIRIDGHTFRWMGVHPRQYITLPAIDAMGQTALTVSPLHTDYTFQQAGVELRATFFTPLLPTDLDTLSRPVTYLSWSVQSTDGAAHDVQIMLDTDPQIAVNDPGQHVTWGRSRAPGLTLLNMGSRDQAVLNRSGDRIRIDWGYFHIGVPDGVTTETSIAFDSLRQFTADGTLPTGDDMNMPHAAEPRTHPAHLAVMFPLGKVAAAPVERHVLLAYTDGYSIEYLNRRLRPYWQRNNMSESTMLAAAETEYGILESKGRTFDRSLTRDMTAAGGPDYAYLTALAYRQTIAAHKLVADVDGTPMLFSKENDSNGCIDTVDVTYPSSPFFLYFNPALLQAQLEPLMRYAASPRWRFPFAPHDLGTYPLANGQVYGGGEETADNQMPVEESGDLILMIAALGRSQGNYDFARKYMPQLKQWAQYLEEKGLDPENQLSTDDFAGHLAHNTGLSMKAILALGAFGQIAGATGDNALAARYSKIAHGLPPKWETMAREAGHYKLAFDQAGTWSQKYNLVWDKLLGLNLFAPAIAQTEWAFYTGQIQPFGLPLDNRKSITKLDWEFWTATLGTPQQSADLARRIATWADTTPSRVPLTDYYDAVSGRQISFQARSVVGGIFILPLMQKHIQ